MFGTFMRVAAGNFMSLGFIQGGLFIFVCVMTGDAVVEVQALITMQLFILYLKALYTLFAEIRLVNTIALNYFRLIILILWFVYFR